MSAGAAASIHARLLALAKERGEDFNLTLNRYALERFLYRLSISPSREHYWLKGALLFDLWFDAKHRPTRDADFLGFGPADADAVRNALAEVCRIEAPDSVVLDPGSIGIEQIRDDARYGGLRVRIAGSAGAAAPCVSACLGGSREAGGDRQPRDGQQPDEGLFRPAGACARGRGRRGRPRRGGTRIPDELPVGLTDEFARDATKVTQWKGFLQKNRLQAPSLGEVVAEVRRFAEPVLRAASRRDAP